MEPGHRDSDREEGVVSVFSERTEKELRNLMTMPDYSAD